MDRKGEEQRLAILTHKFALPGVPRDAFVSERINGLLSRALDTHRHVATVAAAGSGKTVQWQLFASTTALPVTWLTLDRSDASPARLVTSLALALEPVVARAPQVVQSALRDGYSSEEVAAVLAQATAEHGALLVLDAAEAILGVDPAVAVIATFLDYLPPRWRIGLLSREPLSNQLRRRRLDDALGVITEDDLRLTGEEIERWCAQVGAGVDPGELRAATGGWFTGVALGLRAGAAAMEPTGDLSEWLVAEILDPLPTDTQRFLLETAVAERVSEDVAVALCGADGRRLWRDVRRRNLPATTATSSALEYHSLLRAVLLDQLARRTPDKVDGLHRRYAEHLGLVGDSEAATEVLLSIGDLDAAAAAAEQSLAGLYGRADWTVLDRWLGQLGDVRVTSRPALLAARVRALHGFRRFDEVRRLVRQLDLRGELRVVTEADPGVLAIAGLALLSKPAEARRLLGRYEGDYQSDAVRFLIEVTTGSEPAAPPALSSSGEVEHPATWALILQGRLTEVIAQLPDDPRVPLTDLNPILALSLRGDQAGAEAAWDRVPQEIREHPHSLLTEGLILLGRQDVESGLAAIQAAAAESQRTHFWLSGFYEVGAAEPMILFGQVDDAVTLLERRIDTFAESAQTAGLEWAQTFLAVGYIKQSQVELARNMLTECVRSMRLAKRRLLLPMAAIALSEAEFRTGNDEGAKEFADLAYQTSAMTGTSFTLGRALAFFPDVLDREAARDPGDHRWSRLAEAGATSRSRPVRKAGADRAVRLDVPVFGPKRELFVDGERIEVGRVKVMELAAYLARHPDGVDRKLLQQELLPDSDLRRGANHFRQVTHKLREATGISLARRGSRLGWPESVTADSTDVTFERLVVSARNSPGSERAAMLARALDLVTGPYLEYSSLAWADQRRYQLDLLWEETVLEFGELAVGNGSPEPTRAYCERLLAVNPYSEPAYRLLLRVEQVTGTESSRLAIYRRAVEALRELGLEPDDELRAMVRAPG